MERFAKFRMKSSGFRCECIQYENKFAQLFFLNVSVIVHVCTRTIGGSYLGHGEGGEE